MSLQSHAQTATAVVDPPAANGDSQAAPRLAPVAPRERIASIDVLRGFRLLGILVINIQHIALTGLTDMDPRVTGGHSQADLAAWSFTYVVFQSKMMSIFAMLFGAGVVLLDRHSEGHRGSLAATYYRRTGWLMFIGIVHGYFLWEGDILFLYGFCGLFLYPLRQLRPSTLIGLGLVLYPIMSVLEIGIGAMMAWIRLLGTLPVLEGQDTGRFLRSMAEIWKGIESELLPTPEALAEEAAAMQGGYWSLFVRRIPETLGTQMGSLFAFSWTALALMLWGMSLMKLGVWSCARSTRFYGGMIVAGYGLGLPLALAGLYDMHANDFDLVRRVAISEHFNELGSPLVALGHAGVVLLICKTGVLRWATRLLAAVGRTALSNYLMQSFLCTAIFYGWGLGLFGRVNRPALLGIVVGIWALQLAISPIWLHWFRFGPAEWLWRSLTYWRLQPMRVHR